MSIKALRTPEERFAFLPGFPYAPHYLEDLPDYEGLRMAYIDEGPAEADTTFLCLHGEPTWSYLYKAGVRRFPQLVPVEPGMAGIDLYKRARAYYREVWSGESFMAVGMRDAVLGISVMQELRGIIRGCPEPMEIPEAGHFVQEYGGPIARAALDHFGLA